MGKNSRKLKAIIVPTQQYLRYGAMNMVKKNESGIDIQYHIGVEAEIKTRTYLHRRSTPTTARSIQRI